VNPPDEGTGLGWIAIILGGFVIGFILAKLKVLTEENKVNFAAWVSGIVAAVMALGGDLGSVTLKDIAGRLALFFLLWFFLGIVFALGVLMGVDKATKNNVDPTRTRDKPRR